MNYTFFLAKRFLLSRKESRFVSFLTIISIAGVTIGVAALIITISIIKGFEKEITQKAVSLSSHIQITSFKPEGMKDYKTVIDKLKEKLPAEMENAVLTPYVQREAVIKFKDNAEGIILKGIEDDFNLLGYKRKILEGSSSLSLPDTSVSPILIGNKLSQKLGITIGSKIFIIAAAGIPSATNIPDIKAFTVTGIYETTLKEYDDVLLYCRLNTAQKLFNTGGYITGIEVNISNIDLIENTSKQIKSALGYPYNSKSIYQTYKGLFTWVELHKEPVPIILGLIIIVAAFNMIAFLLMIVLEKIEAIGILKTLGARNTEILKIFFLQGVFITFSGIILGNLLGYGLCIFQSKYNLIKLPEVYYMNTVPLEITANSGIVVTLITLVLGCIVTIFPSLLSSRLNPVTSIRFK